MKEQIFGKKWGKFFPDSQILLNRG